MKSEILDTPDFGMVRLRFDRPGETVIAESGAMVSMSVGLKMTTKMRGGLLQAAKRRIMGGESLFQNTFESTAAGQEVLLAPAAEGAVVNATLAAGEKLFLQSGAYLAHTGDLKLDGKVAGLRSFFGGVGFFMLQCEGPGELYFNSYGALHEIEVGPEGYVCDNGHIVAFTEGLSYEVRKFGGFKGLFFSGEGLITHFRGQGQVFVQTRNAPALANFLEPYRRVQRSSNS